MPGSNKNSDLNRKNTTSPNREESGMKGSQRNLDNQQGIGDESSVKKNSSDSWQQGSGKPGGTTGNTGNTHNNSGTTRGTTSNTGSTANTGSNSNTGSNTGSNRGPTSR